ncbi:hypothetical protein ASF54_13055 [Frondihabitans sp. Leaf304]|nr:hypothetical protein ASF54_13055 [Frondihabitans sp. Leaf304]
MRRSREAGRSVPVLQRTGMRSAGILPSFCTTVMSLLVREVPITPASVAGRASTCFAPEGRCGTSRAWYSVHCANPKKMPTTATNTTRIRAHDGHLSRFGGVFPTPVSPS